MYGPLIHCLDATRCQIHVRPHLYQRKTRKACIFALTNISKTDKPQKMTWRVTFLCMTANGRPFTLCDLTLLT